MQVAVAVSCVWGKRRRAIARDVALLIAPRNCSEEVGKVSVHVIWVKEVPVIKHRFFQKVTAGIMKVTAGHKEGLSP